jgi:hypothetical protein
VHVCYATVQLDDYVVAIRQLLCTIAGALVGIA